MRVDDNKFTYVVVPVRLVGDAPGMKKGGVLVQKLWDLKIRCKPSQIPVTIDVSIAKLDLDEFISIKDLQDQFDFDILNNEKDSIVRITSSRISMQDEEGADAEGETAEGGESDDTATDKTDSD